MSTAATPNRHARGMPVPGIDTRAFKRDASTSLPFGGWLTPPQSVHESRRPSLAYSSHGEIPYSAGSTATSLSLPPTPIHGSSERLQQFAYPISNDHGHADMMPGLSASFSNDHLSENLVHATMEDQTECNANHGMVWSQHGLPMQPVDDFGMHSSPAHNPSMWHEQQLPEQSYLRQTGSLQPTLFSTNISIVPEQPTMSSDYLNSSHQMIPSVSSMPGLQYGSPTSGYYSCLVPVEPSQISPEDSYPGQHYSSFSSPDRSPHNLSGSFESSSGSFDSFDALEPPSPDGDYYAEDEDTVIIKNEAMMSPSPYGNFEVLPRRSLLPSETSTLPNRMKISKRQRKSQVTQHRRNRCGGIDLKLEGENITFNSQDEVVWQNVQRSKTNRCGFIEEDGTICRVAFARSEHLKRHMGKHSPDRKFPCPLNGCKRAIGRSDNACDHFRTHLKLVEKNRRNQYFHWDIVKHSIEKAYEKNASTKMINNLIRWLEQGSEELQSAHNIGQFRYKL